MRGSNVLEKLQRRGLTLVTAESCTAGLISAVLSQGEGASEVFHGGFVTYTKAGKSESLGVSAGLLAREGAVNASVAAQMVTGALSRSPADLGLAVTGVLGPDPDEDGNPVGLVFLACGRRGMPPQIIRRDYGPEQHDMLRRATVLDAFALVERYAGGEPGVEPK